MNRILVCHEVGYFEYINGMGFVHELYVFGTLMVCVWGRWCDAQLYIPSGIKGNPRGRGGKGGPEGLPW